MPRSRFGDMGNDKLTQLRYEAFFEEAQRAAEAQPVASGLGPFETESLKG